MVDRLEYNARKQAWDSAAERATTALSRFNEVQQQVLIAKVNFFEKLALFNTGTIAATITMAAGLRQHGELHWKIWLFIGWSSLITAMALCLYRNWKTQSHLYYTTLAAWRTRQARAAKAESAFHVVNPGLLVNDLGQIEDREAHRKSCTEEAEEIDHLAKRLDHFGERDFTHMKWSENVALVLTISGVISELVFTIRNFQ